MVEVILALVALAVGALFCFSGYAALRVIFPIWGFVTGFSIGAAGTAGLLGSGFLGTTMGWVVGFFVAILFAVLAYLFYEAAVVIFCGTIGFWLGSGIVVGLGGTRGSVLSTLTGIVLGVVLAGVAFLYNAPKYLLYVLSAIGGSVVMIAGVLLLINEVDVSALTHGAVTVVIKHSVFWTIVWLTLAVVGFITQYQLTKNAELVAADEWK
jgi:hypothetical protein